MEKRELYHYGVKGMKWGVRKAQVRSAGAKISKRVKKYAVELSKKRKARKAEEAKREREQYLTKTNVKKLTSDELVERAKILALRKQALDIERSCKQVNSEIVNNGKSFIKKFASEAVGAAAISAGKSVLGDYFVKLGKDALGLKEVKSKDPEVKTWDDKLKKLQYENAKKSAKDGSLPVNNWDDLDKKRRYEKEVANDNKEKRAAAQKLVDDYNKKWLSGEVKDRVTPISEKKDATYSLKGKDIVDSTTPVNSSSTTALAVIGKDYVNDLLDDKK